MRFYYGLIFFLLSNIATGQDINSENDGSVSVFAGSMFINNGGGPTAIYGVSTDLVNFHGIHFGWEFASAGFTLTGNNYIDHKSILLTAAYYVWKNLFVDVKFGRAVQVARATSTLAASGSYNESGGSIGYDFHFSKDTILGFEAGGYSIANTSSQIWTGWMLNIRKSF